MSLSLQNITAQKSPFSTTEKALFNDGETYFAKKNYAAASRYFEKYLTYQHRDNEESVRQAEYYIAKSAFELRKKDAKFKLEEYQKKYAYATNIELIDLYIGILEYESGKYKQAIKRFEKMDTDKLNETEMVQLFFYKGYAYHEQEDYEKSSYEFQQVLRRSNSPYIEPATYYYAYAEYRLGNVDTALKNFLKVEDNPDFKMTAPYFIAQIYYQKGECEKLLSYGKNVLSQYPKNTKNNEIIRMMGECSFSLKDYKTSINLLNTYQKNTKKISREDYYLLGMGYYMTEDYPNAITNLSKTTNQEDSLTQNSYTHIAMSYIKLNDKKNARMAFEAASRYAFDKSLQEEALFNYALVTYELSFSPFNESVGAFERFLKEFPNSKHNDKVYEYLANSYLTTKNYAEAYKSIQNLNTKNTKILEAEQRILFNMGTTAVANNNIEKASQNFQKVINGKTYNQDISTRSYFWYGECLFRMKKYNEAEKNFQNYINSSKARSTDEYELAHYNLGYTYFMLKDYNSAINWFRKYITFNDGSPTMLLDANNRIGDCYFQNRQFLEAKRYYSQAITTGKTLPGADYATFQKAFVTGLQKEYTEKIAILRGLISSYPNSEWQDDALFEIGNTYILLKENDKAIETFAEIEKKFEKNNPMSRKAKLQIAMLQYNGGNTNQALVTYKSIVSEYPASEEAKTSLDAIETILVDNNKVDEYSQFVNSLGTSSLKIAPSREDSLMYKAAQKVYAREDISQATKSFEKYLQTFPQGKYNTTARYYLANCYYVQKDKSKALGLYKTLISDKENPNQEESLARAAEISYDLGQYAEAIDYFRQLEQIGDQDNKMAAKIGLMRCSYTLKNYDEAINSAKNLIEFYPNNLNLVEEARYKKMESYIAMNNSEAAVSDMQSLAQDTRSNYGAEAKYLLANYYFTHQQYDAAEKEIFDFIEKGTPHQQWLAKSFILLSDVYMQKENYFEAKQYLLSLKDNYTSNDKEINEAINTRLEKLRKIESETVVEKTNPVE